MTVGEFKAKFSELIKIIRNGEEIAVSFGKKKKNLLY
jgi:antitoxin (DNA-binding transcriptional repressor) of toxin-antitoxin stability system